MNTQSDNPLAERRLFEARRAADNLIDLYKSGRWRGLYTEEGFLSRARELQSAVAHWETLVHKHE
jgi:hypothetical protein